LTKYPLLARFTEEVRSWTLFNFLMHYVVVGHALEGWLLADVEAVRRYLKGVVPVTPSATLDCKPKEVMRGLFRKAGRNFLSDRDGPKMAEMMDLDKASKRNKSLATFREILRDP